MKLVWVKRLAERRQQISLVKEMRLLHASPASREEKSLIDSKELVCNFAISL